MRYIAVFLGVVFSVSVGMVWADSDVVLEVGQAQQINGEQVIPIVLVGTQEKVGDFSFKLKTEPKPFRIIFGPGIDFKDPVQEKGILKIAGSASNKEAFLGVSFQDFSGKVELRLDEVEVAGKKLPGKQTEVVITGKPEPEKEAQPEAVEPVSPEELRKKTPEERLGLLEAKLAEVRQLKEARRMARLDGLTSDIRQRDKAVEYAQAEEALLLELLTATQEERNSRRNSRQHELAINRLEAEILQYILEDTSFQKLADQQLAENARVRRENGGLQLYKNAWDSGYRLKSRQAKLKKAADSLKPPSRSGFYGLVGLSTNAVTRSYRTDYYGNRIYLDDDEPRGAGWLVEAGVTFEATEKISLAGFGFYNAYSWDKGKGTAEEKNRQQYGGGGEVRYQLLTGEHSSFLGVGFMSSTRGSAASISFGIESKTILLLLRAMPGAEQNLSLGLGYKIGV